MILSTENLSKKYGDFLAVSDVNLQVEEKTTHAIIGPNGAGKTTLFNTLTGEIPITSGKVFYKGTDITNSKPFQVARYGIGRSFQKNNLFSELSVLENIRIGVHAHTPGHYNFFRDFSRFTEPIQKSLRIIDMLEMGNIAKKKAGELSHGEQRKLEIAVALSAQPEMILLDEPTSGMSPGEAMEMMEMLRVIGENLTIVIIEHNMDVVLSISDKVTVLQQGKILATDIPERIVKNADVKKAYLGE